MAPLTGRLNIVPVGASCVVNRTNYRGPGRLQVKGCYEKARFEACFLGRKFSLVGNVATFRLTVSALSELDLFVAYLDALFPALFSGAFHAPIDVEEIDGTLQGFSFTFRSRLSVSNAPLCTSATLPLKEYFDSTSPQEFIPAIFLIASLRYLQQADRLQAEGRHLTTFLAERILNIAKAIEAIFPNESVDMMRDELKKMKIDATYIDIFSSVKYLRNQVDVGHVSFSDLPLDSVQDVLNFADLATHCLKIFVNNLLRNRERQEHLLSLRKNTVSSKVPDAIKYIKKYRDILRPDGNNLEIPPKKI